LASAIVRKVAGSVVARGLRTSPQVFTGTTYQHFINGQYTPPSAGQYTDVHSPRDGKTFARIAEASVGDVHAAIEAARTCFDDHDGAWRQTTVAERSSMLNKMAASLEARRDEFAKLETMDCGKPIAESEADIDFCIDIMRYYAKIAPDAMAQEKLETNDPEFVASIDKEAFGVIGCITPWNYPLMQAVNKVAPALAAGCTVVLKPSPLASITNVLLGELANDAGVPAGVLNIVTGGPPAGAAEASEALGSSPLLDKLSFTGSGPTGKRLLHASAEHLRPTSLELGGKGAIVVFEDTDLKAVADWVMVGIFLCAGQVCSATSRLLVHESVQAELLDILCERTAAIKIGDPLLPDTLLGPMVSASQAAMVTKAIQAAVEVDGCTLRAGGAAKPSSTADGELSNGYFVQPTILTDVPLTSSAWNEEIFGPVLSVRSFKTEDEAVAAANASPYGLAHAVMTQDEARLNRVASRLRAGVVYRNCSQVGFLTTPFGGYKQSGFGREWGEVGLEEYIHHKTITSAVSPSFTWEWYHKATAKL